MNRYIVVYEERYKRAGTLASYLVTANTEEEAIEKIKKGEAEKTQEEFMGGKLVTREVHEITNIGIG